MTYCEMFFGCISFRNWQVARPAQCKLQGDVGVPTQSLSSGGPTHLTTSITPPTHYTRLCYLKHLKNVCLPTTEYMSFAGYSLFITPGCASFPAALAQDGIQHNRWLTGLLTPPFTVCVARLSLTISTHPNNPALWPPDVVSENHNQKSVEEVTMGKN